VVKDKVIVGTSGVTTAYEASFPPSMRRPQAGLALLDHSRPWRAGSESWPGDAYLRGGGTTWMPGTYDPELNTLYWGTSNPAPDFDGGRGPATIFTRLRARAGPRHRKTEVHFQFTPHDLFDYDATETPVWSIYPTGDGPESCSSRPTEMGSSTCSIARMVNFYRRRHLSTN